ncbi:PspC domain-containing protein [Actinomadura sp. B10D3]|uniref:PspC domain-containing protein n=1 Tax=Actinomadura sp. B10D3 TaxID=3153557 RepID=UPI00325F8EB9
MGEEETVQSEAVQQKADAGYRRLTRDTDRRLLAGVCSGLGRYTGIDPVVFRVGFAILALAHGQGVFLYIAAALLMPASPQESSLAEQLLKRWFDAQGVLSILGGLLGVGVVLSLTSGVSTDSIAMLVVFGLVLLVARSRGVDLVSAARAVPERVTGHTPEPSASWVRQGGAGVSLGKDEPRPAEAGGLPEGMIDLAAYSAAWEEPEPVRPAAPARERERDCGGRSPVATITLLAAMAAGAAMIPVAQAYTAPDSWLIVMAPALAVIGCGLVLGGWFRTRGLAAAGTVLTLAMLTTAVAGDAPRNAEYGDVQWRPTDPAQTNQVYKVGVGQGDLDLTALPLAAGQRVEIEARIGVGGLTVTLPPAARVLLDAKIAVGDLSVGRRTTSGPNARDVRTLEPESGSSGNPPVIVLRIRGKFGDVDVNRG